jgi:hypothetical protein
MSPRAFVPVLLVVLLLLSGCLSGCVPGGAEERGAGRIARDAVNTLRRAETVRLTGQVTEQSGPVTLDMRISRDKGARGWFSQDGVDTDLIRIGDRLWLRGESFWVQTLGPARASEIGGRWVLMPPEAGSDVGIDAITDLDAVAEQVLSPVSRDELTKGQTSVIRGTPAIALTTGDGGRLDVATRGPAYPLRFGGGGQRIDFAEYNKPVRLTPPAGAIALPG